MPGKPLLTIVETPAFSGAAGRLLSDEQLDTLKVALAADPEMGAVMRGTGGVRKVRWALAGRGKSGGARIIYFYHNDHMPLFLLFAYPKSERDNLTRAEQNTIKKLTTTLVRQYTKRSAP
jgi:hypothetical protein